MHASASGLVFMAFAHPRVAKSTLSKKLNSFTDATLIDAEQIRAKFVRIREQGFVISKNGYEDGVSSVAAPIFSGGEYAEGAVAVAGPNARLKDRDLVALQDKIIAAAQEISAQLGEPAA